MINSAELIGEDPRSSKLKPITSWQRTGLVEPGTSGPGCAVSCIYCNQIAMDSVDGERQAPYLSGMVDAGVSINTRMYVGHRLDKVISSEQILLELAQWPLYTPDTPVILENFNDPGNDWIATAGLAKSLVERGHKAAIAFITKMGIKSHEVNALVDVQKHGANLVAIVTYTNMPKEIEPASSRVRLNTIRRLSEAGIPVVVSMRPLIRGVNDSQANIDMVLNQVAPYATCIIVGGLFVFEKFTLDAFIQAGYPLDDFYRQQIYSPAKTMAMGYKEIVRSRVAELGLDLLVHNHTSCAIAQVMTSHYDTPTSDRFAHWISPRGLEFDDDCAHCPTEQKSICVIDQQQQLADVVEKAKSALKKLGYPTVNVIPSINLPNTILIENGILTFEELTFVKEACRWYVDNLPNPAGMYHRLSQALAESMQLDIRNYLVGMLLLGQEWHIIIRKNDKSKEVQLIEKWIRSHSRHRCHVLLLEDLQLQGLEQTAKQFIEKSHGLQADEVITAEVIRLFSA